MSRLEGETRPFPWARLAGVWTILTAFSFLGVLLAMIWWDGPIGKLWLTWVIAGLLGSFFLGVIASVKDRS